MTPELAELSRTIDAAELGRRIKATRIAAGMTQAQVAGEDVSTAYVSRIEDGQRRPEAGLLERMAGRIGTTLEELLLGVSVDKERELQVALDHAELSLASGDAAAALAGADRVLSELDHLRGTAMIRTAQYVRAIALEKVGDLEGAIYVFEDLTSEPVADASWLRALIALSRCYRDSGDLARAIAVGDRAAALIDDLGVGGLTEAIQLTITVAGAQALQGDTGYALRTCMRALESAEAVNSPVAKASAYWNASVIESTRGASDAALGLARKAMAHFELGEDSRNLAKLRAEIANLQLLLDPPDPAGALETLDRAERELAWSSASAFDIANQLLTRSRAHFLLGETAEAAAALTKSVETSPPDAPVLRASTLVLQGQVAAAEGRIDDARTLYQQAVGDLTAVGADKDAAQLWFELGALLTEVGETAAALDAYRRAGASTGLRTVAGSPTLTHEPA